ncbi:MAG: SpoIIE family protein phosphatase [Vulcanimicrobiaceae bacterium]
MDKGAAEAIYRVAVEADPNLVFIADPQGRIIRVNSRWVEFTGVDPTGIGPGDRRAFEIAHPDEIERMWDAWQIAIETGDIFEVSYRLKSAKDGRYRWFLARAVPARGADGEIVGWFGAATDIDEQVRAAHRARFLSEAAEALSSSLDRERIMDALMRVAIDRFSDGIIITLRGPDGMLRRTAVAHRDPEIGHRAREKAARISVEDNSVVMRVSATKESLLIPDVDDSTHTGWRNAGGVQVARTIESTRSLLVVPLLLAERVAGTITFVSTGEAPPFDDFDRTSAEAVARQAATALEHAAAFAREREATERFRYLAHATDQLFATRDLNQELETLLQSLVGYWADRAILYVLGPDGGIRAHAVAYADSAGAPVEQYRGERLFVPAAEAQMRDLIEKRRTLMRTDVSVESLRENIQPYLWPVVDQMAPRSLIVVPLYTADYDFGTLGVYLAKRNYSEADREMFEELGRRLSLAIEHARSLHREQRLGRTLQEITLPQTLSSIPGAVISTAYAAATTSDAPVGGDWYDAFTLRNGNTLLMIGDVTGNGLQASAIMGKLRNAMNAVALYESDPARILDATEYILLQRYPDNVATAFVAILDPTNGRLTYANAGHPAPLLRLWDGTLDALAADGLPLGSRNLAAPAVSKTRSLEGVAMIAFYTDGITEVKRDLYLGEKTLFDALSTDGILYVSAAATLLADSCIPEGAHDDDAALMVLSFPRSLGWSFEAENARAAQTARGAFLEKLRNEATLESDLSGAEIVFGELVGNVVRHAPGPIDVALEWRKDQAVLHVIDRGPGFEYAPPRDVDIMREDGRGLWLTSQFSEHVYVERLPNYGTHVGVVLPVWRSAKKSPVSDAAPKRAKAAASARR